MGTKKCTGPCGETKPIDAFSRRSASADGRQPRCKACLKVQASLRELTPEQKAAKVADTTHRRREDPAYRERQRESNRKSMIRTGNAQVRRARLLGADHEPYDRAEIFARWNGRCCYCDAPAEHLDHIRAISRGGADAERNLVPACKPCNSSKNAKSLAEWATTF